MSAYSIATSVVRKNVTSFILGATCGFLGYRAIEWFRGCRTSSSHGIIHIIVITENGLQVQQVQLHEFKAQITYDAINDLRKSIGWKARPEKTWQGIFERSTYTVCVIKGKELVGYGRFVGDTRMGTIYDVNVHSQHQKQKIGTLIMNHLIDQIKTQEYTSVCLFGWSENPSVLDFYAKFGFESNPHGMESSGSKLKSVS